MSSYNKSFNLGLITINLALATVTGFNLDRTVNLSKPIVYKGEYTVVCSGEIFTANEIGIERNVVHFKYQGKNYKCNNYTIYNTGDE